MKVPAISGKKVISILKRLGFRESRKKGDHVRLIKSTSERPAIKARELGEKMVLERSKIDGAAFKSQMIYVMSILR